MLDKFKIGLLDLLTILLPGGLLLLLLGNRLNVVLFYQLKGYPRFAEQWIFVGIAFGSAYIVGHFIFFLSSFLDDLIYEKVRKVYWHHHIKLTAYILMLKEKATGITDRKVLNAWKWASAWLLSNEPELYAEVERHMAESKFFRSLVIVLVVTAAVFVSDRQDGRTIAMVLLLLFLSLIRYLTQRQKSLETAYHGLITAFGQVLPKEPDPVVLAGLKKDLLYPSENLLRRIEQRNETKPSGLRLDKAAFAILQFLYTAGLCLIPGFTFLVRSPADRKKGNQLHQEAQRRKRLFQNNAVRYTAEPVPKTH